MRFVLKVMLYVILLMSSAQGIMYLFSGSDSYGQGLVYPEFSGSHSLATLVALDNTTQMAPVYMGATLYWPEIWMTDVINYSDYYHMNRSRPGQSTFYIGNNNSERWPSKGNGTYAPSVKDFRHNVSKSKVREYDSPSIKQFIEEDEYKEGIEEHNDPDYDGLVRFLGDDEPPQRPLL